MTGLSLSAAQSQLNDHSKIKAFVRSSAVCGVALPEAISSPLGKMRLGPVASSLQSKVSNDPLICDRCAGFPVWYYSPMAG